MTVPPISGRSCLVWSALYALFPYLSSVSAYSFTAIDSVLFGIIEGTAQVANAAMSTLRLPKQADELWNWNLIKTWPNR